MIAIRPQPNEILAAPPQSVGILVSVSSTAFAKILNANAQIATIPVQGTKPSQG